MKNAPNPFVGAWELVSGSCVGADGSVMNYERSNVKSLKVLSEGKFYAAGAGDVLIENNTYTEIPLPASEPSMIGQRYAFQYKLEGETWTNPR